MDQRGRSGGDAGLTTPRYPRLAERWPGTAVGRRGPERGNATALEGRRRPETL